MPQTNVTIAKKLAKKLGVTVEPSENKCKKLDVFDQKGKKVASIGSRQHEDFLTHNDSKRRANFKSRMERHRNKVGTPAFYADKILWPSDAQLEWNGTRNYGSQDL